MICNPAVNGADDVTQGRKNGVLLENGLLNEKHSKSPTLERVCVSLPFYMYTRNMTLIWSDSWPTGLNQQHGITFNFFSKHSHSHRRLLLTFVWADIIFDVSSRHFWRLLFILNFPKGYLSIMCSIINRRQRKPRRKVGLSKFQLRTCTPFQTEILICICPINLKSIHPNSIILNFDFPLKKKLIIYWTTSLSISFTLMDWEENGNPKDVALKLAMKNEL